MNHEKIMDEYTKSPCKTRTVNELAKKYGVAQSDVIFELLKTGYKFEELKRGCPGAYKPAVKKYEKWKAEGGTLEAEQDVDVMAQYTQNEAAVAEDQDKTENLKAEIKELKKQLEAKKVQEFNEAVDGMVEENKLKQRIRGLEEEVEEAMSEKAKSEQRVQELTVECAGKIDELLGKLAEQEQLTEDTMRLLKIRDEELSGLKEKCTMIENAKASDGEFIEALKDDIDEIFKATKTVPVGGGEVLAADKLAVILDFVENASIKIETLQKELHILDEDFKTKIKTVEAYEADSERLLKAERYILDNLVYAR